MLNLIGEISGKTTKKEIKEVIEATGLNQKIFPIAYISFKAGTVPFGTINSYLSNSGFDVGILVYSDIYGKVNIKLSGTLESSVKLEAELAVVKDGKVVNDSSLKIDEDNKAEFKFIASASVRYDIIGIGVNVTVGNITILEVDIADLYVQLDAKVAFEASFSRKTKTDFADPNNNLDSGWEGKKKIEASGYGGLYIDFLRYQLKFKIKTLNKDNDDYKPKTNFNLETDNSLYTCTIFKFGADNNDLSTSPDYDYNEVSATTPKYEIYRNSGGELVRKELESGEIAFYELKDFVVICGIDKTYIYVLKSRK